jgi:hypothetical protein
LLADPRVDPSDEDNDCIKVAASSGYAEVVRLLLADPRVDPSSEGNLALSLAKEYGHEEVVRLLS